MPCQGLQGGHQSGICQGYLKKGICQGYLKKGICQGYVRDILFGWLIIYKISKTTRKSDKTAQQNLNFSPAALVFPPFNIMTYLKTTRKFHALLTRMRINAKNTLKMSGIFYILSGKCQGYVRDICSRKLVATLHDYIRERLKKEFFKIFFVLR